MKPSSIGRLATIRHNGKLYTASIIDVVAGTGKAKRVRIQGDKGMAGAVLMPNSYDIVEFLT